MTSVWKFPIQRADAYTIDMTKDAEILHVGVQKNEPFMWARVDPDAPKERRGFRVAGTGHALYGAPEKHYGSFMLNDGALVFHVFEWSA